MDMTITFSGGKASVTDGPFLETNGLIAGYWVIRVNSREEAIQWASRAPAPHDGGAAVWQAIRACRWLPGADAEGRPMRIWVTMPLRFVGG